MSIHFLVHERIKSSYNRVMLQCPSEAADLFYNVLCITVLKCYSTYRVVHKWLTVLGGLENNMEEMVQNLEYIVSAHNLGIA